LALPLAVAPEFAAIYCESRCQTSPPTSAFADRLAALHNVAQFVTYISMTDFSEL
jgi:hypothetical protein